MRFFFCFNLCLIQSFTYDAHDKLTNGTAGNEIDGYDPNGNENNVIIYGATYHDIYDDEDRLVSAGVQGGLTDTFTYNGLGLRVGKTDSTGTYSYICDGASPGASVLSDGYAVYTPGLSENRNGVTSYYSNDRLGNLWTLNNSSGGQIYYQDTTSFGVSLAIGGNTATPYRFGGGNGCQTDSDFGLVLMGRRYYDARIGRFISQDPAGEGENPYTYSENNPANEIDPSGLGQNTAYSLDPISAAQAFAGMFSHTTLNPVLTTNYQYYSVSTIIWDTTTNKIIKIVSLGYIAVPNRVNLLVNYQIALSDRSPDATYSKTNTEAYFRGKKNGIAENTKGDFKKNGKLYPLPSNLTPRLKNQLVKLLDHGGNFNGGMVAEGYGTMAWENELIGGYAKAKSDHVLIEPDDRTGQSFFSAGWNYAKNMDPN